MSYPISFSRSVRLSVLALCLAPVLAHAQLTFNLNQAINGASPGGSTPWLSATFTQVNSTTIDLTMSAPGLLSGEKIDAWGFNLNPTLSVANLAWSNLSTTPTANITGSGSPPAFSITSGTNFPGSGSEHFDFGFEFDSSDGGPHDSFVTGDTVVVRLTYNDGASGTIGLSDFIFGSDPNGYFSGAHVQGITDIGQGTSGLVVATSAIPEPSTYAAMLGVIAFGFAAFRRFRKKDD